MIVIEFILSNFILGMIGGMIVFVLVLSVKIVVGTVMYVVEGIRFIQRRIL